MIVALLIIIIVILIAGIVFVAIPGNQNNNTAVNNSAKVNDTVANATLQSSSDDESSQASTPAKHYDDWQKDYETGEYDEDGNPIYRSVMSTSGGQYEPGIYEAYWSANGPISEERIG